MRNLNVFCVAGAIALCGAACAEDLVLATDPFNEIVSDTARISGQFVAGLQMSSAPGPDMSLTAFVPKSWQAQTVCVRVVTVNGLYLAANEYTVGADWAGGDATVPYPPSDKNAPLAGRPDNSVSVRVSKGTCDSDARDLALSAWGAAQDAPGLLINAFQAGDVFLYLDGVDAPVRCTEAPLDTRITYDHICPLPDPMPSGAVATELLRVVDGQVQPAEAFTLWLP